MGQVFQTSQKIFLQVIFKKHIYLFLPTVWACDVMCFLMPVFVLLQKSKQVLQGSFMSSNCSLQASTILKLASKRLIRKLYNLNQRYK